MLVLIKTIGQGNQMKIRTFLIAIFLVPLVCSNIFVIPFFTVDEMQFEEDFFFGVTFGGNTTNEAKLLIDKVKGYTNLFVVASWAITGAKNETALDEICQYAVDAEMNVVVYFDFI